MKSLLLEAVGSPDYMCANSLVCICVLGSWLHVDLERLTVNDLFFYTSLLVL